MTLQPEVTLPKMIVELLIENGLNGLPELFKVLMNEAMQLERSQFLKADRHERTPERIGYANGFKDKVLSTRLGKIPLRIPQVRNLPSWMDGFYPQSLTRGIRSEQALKLALAEMYIQGVSTRKVKEITEVLCGFEISSTEVSRAAKLLDEELAVWRNRPLDEVVYLSVDAKYISVRYGGQVRDCSVLIAQGILPNGKRSILGVSVSLSEAEVHWKAFFRSLKERGMQGVKLVTSDDHAGLKAARQAELGSIPWQRCQYHLQQNALKYVPRVSLKRPVAGEIRSIFNAKDLSEAQTRLEAFVEKYRQIAPDLADWAEENLPEGFTVFDFPESHQRRIRTSNSLERLNEEIERRVRVIRIFPNTEALLRLVSTLLVEYSERWETGKIYLNMNSQLDDESDAADQFYRKDVA